MKNKRIILTITIPVLFIAVLFLRSIVIDSPQLAMQPGDRIYFGGYRWIVLDIEDNHALIITEQIIFRKQFHHVLGPVTWETSTLRHYLNNEFFESFSETERNHIRKTNITTANNPWFWTNGGNDTEDYIFLLCLFEVVYYFGDSGQLLDRLPHTFDIVDEYNNARLARDEYNTPWWWWLRSPGNESFRAAGIFSSGHLGVAGNGVIWDGGGVRPVLWLNIGGFNGTR